MRCRTFRFSLPAVDATPALCFPFNFAKSVRSGHESLFSRCANWRFRLEFFSICHLNTPMWRISGIAASSSAAAGKPGPKKLRSVHSISQSIRLHGRLRAARSLRRGLAHSRSTRERGLKGVVSKNTNGIESSTLEALWKSAETNRRRADSAKGERLEDPRYRAVRWRAPTPMRLRGGNS